MNDEMKPQAEAYLEGAVLRRGSVASGPPSRPGPSSRTVETPAQDPPPLYRATSIPASAMVALRIPCEKKTIEKKRKRHALSSLISSLSQ